MNFRAFSIGFSTAVLALACGSDSGGDNDNDDPIVQPSGDVTCLENPYVVDCVGEYPRGFDANGNPIDSNDGDPDDNDPDDGDEKKEPPKADDQRALQQAAIENILLTECGSCHGSQLTEATRSGGMNFIDDLDRLVLEEKLIPLQGDQSILIQKMRAAEMPPFSSGRDPIDDATINQIRDFMDNPDYWPDVAGGGDCEDVIDFDQLYEEVADDLGDAEADDALNFRYISLTNRVTSGVCADGTALDRDRNALIKMMNALSIRARISKPEPINQERTIYRIDLRDYEWDRAINVEGADFDDVWEAIIDANEYAVPFVGDQADDARDDSGTDVPVMFLDSMLDQAIIGNLYYAIVEIDVNNSVDDFILNELGIDVEANLDEEILVRAGTTKSRISRQDRLVEGHDLEDRDGVFYQSFDFEDNADNDNIFADPFGFNEGGREAIFNLPNGMLAYIIADANGAIVEDSNILFDTNQGNFRALTSVSCSGCHAQGLLPVVDEVRAVVTRNALDLIEDGTLDRDQLEQLEEVYLPADEFKARIEQDSEFYLSALRQADLPLSGGDPIQATFARFDRDVSVADAAGDLGVSREVLLRELNNLEEVDVLDGGTLDRDDFTATYVVNLCVLSGLLENQPDQIVCDEAEALLDQ